MAKILRSGRTGGPFPDLECDECGCRWRPEEGDDFRSGWIGGDVGPERYFTMACPECGAEQTTYAEHATWPFRGEDGR